MDDGAPAEYTVIPASVPIPDESYGMNLGGPNGGKVVCMNLAAYAEYRANTLAFLAKVCPTGHISDIPFSIAE